MIDASLHLPATFLHEAFSNRSGVPLDSFELYYRGKRLEGKAALSSWGVEKDSTIEVKMRGRGGMPRLDDSPSDHRSGLQSSRPEGGAGAEATLALETAAAASAASSTGAQEGAGILRSALSRIWSKTRGRGGVQIHEGETIPVTEGARPAVEDLTAVEVTEATTGPALAESFPVALAAAAVGKPAPAPDHDDLSESSADPGNLDVAKDTVKPSPAAAAAGSGAE
eukprot:scaffold3823_cov60-Phaeocystis_antarctica.AAC.1